jgi:hypothetical protein
METSVWAFKIIYEALDKAAYTIGVFIDLTKACVT